MKTKPGLATRTVAATVLTRVIDDKRGLDGVLGPHGGNTGFQNLAPQDQGLVRAITTTALRHRGEIEYAMMKVMDRKPPKNARHLIHTLHVAAAQILFLDVPDSAAVDLAVTALKEDQRSVRFSNLANAILRRMSREKDILFEKLSDSDRALLNVAPWLKKRIRKGYGKQRLAEIAQQHMLEPLIDVTVKADPERWAKELGGVRLFGNSIRVHNTDPVQTWPGYEDGQWWVQDAAAHLPAYLLGDINGKRVADICAAPGGKTAQLVEAGAEVTALEINQNRLDRLRANLQRLKLQADIKNADLFEWKPEELFDAVLLDAPCSSTGTIRRHPDVQWTKSDEDVTVLADMQKAMILHAATLVKPGGVLVFSNCSLDRQEGEDTYAAIAVADNALTADAISASEVFGLSEIITGQGTLRTLPSHLQMIEPPSNTKIDTSRFQGMDGFFAARFICNHQ